MLPIFIKLFFVIISTLNITNINTSEVIPTHETAVISVHISESDTNEIMVKLVVETPYLSILNLMYQDNFMVSVKKYFDDNLQIMINDKPQFLKLKSISKGEEYTGIQYKITSISSVENLKITSDCMEIMEEHDVMSFTIDLKNELKKAQITKKHNTIIINY